MSDTPSVGSCVHCGQPVEYKTDCADAVDRWMHVGITDADDPFGRRKTRYLECRALGTVAEPSPVYR